MKALVRVEEKPQDDSFQKGAYVISDSGSIVLCDGQSHPESFSGTLLKKGTNVMVVEEGEYYTEWAKEFFRPFHGSITIKI